MFVVVSSNICLLPNSSKSLFVGEEYDTGTSVVHDFVVSGS